MNIRTLAVVAALALLACSKSGQKGSTGPTATGTQANPSATDAGAAAPAANTYYVRTVCSMKREPDDAGQVKDAKGKSVSNWVETLQRGEKVTLVETKAVTKADPKDPKAAKSEPKEWARVRASDDKEGWLSPTYIFSAENVTEATVLVPTDTFDRPDMLAMNVKRKITPGSLILVVKNRDLFAQVSLPGTSTTPWVLNDKLTADPKAVMQAKLIDKARWLNERKQTDDAKAVLAALRSNFSGSPLVDVLAAELGEPVGAPGPGEGKPPSNTDSPPSGGSPSGGEAEGD